MRIENPSANVRGTFTTTASLSERAQEFARVLEITVEQGVPLADYPRIKCNIADATGERIYHLPLDQQYDTTVIEPGRGERYVATVAGAEALGFRRASRVARPGCPERHASQFGRRLNASHQVSLLVIEVLRADNPAVAERRELLELRDRVLSARDGRRRRRSFLLCRHFPELT